MPVKSYLAFSHEGRYPHMIARLEQCDGVSVYPAENRNVAVVVTSSDDESSEQRVKSALEAIVDIHCLTLVFGYADPAPFAV
ncbi:hypothetical protein [Acanthopleuribacter pedis]|uniref:Uncharacterized protein n=1 Tax=Acanthopleuribacter pedis TaxID=442870 RepID=A0A8J7U466_9BACT|nr:hypothetical protein [Acanthopleuribacter pedis]MBO1319078.1 hypothetical protein [Acanthopleuribacter pedis]